jgi:hypothetical protein
MSIKIAIPADVEATIEIDDKTTQPLKCSLRDFIVRTVLRDQKWGADTDWLYAAMEIRGLFNTATPGQVVELTQDQYDKLLSVLNKPTNPYNPAVALELVSLFDAIRKPKP